MVVQTTDALTDVTTTGMAPAIGTTTTGMTSASAVIVTNGDRATPGSVDSNPRQAVPATPGLAGHHACAFTAKTGTAADLPLNITSPIASLASRSPSTACVSPSSRMPR